MAATDGIDRRLADVARHANGMGHLAADLEDRSFVRLANRVRRAGDCMARSQLAQEAAWRPGLAGDVVLHVLASDPSAPVRLRALLGLQQRRSKRAFVSMVQRLRVEPNAWLRAMLAQTLLRIRAVPLYWRTGLYQDGALVDFDWVEALATDPNPLVRLTVTQHLSPQQSDAARLVAQMGDHDSFVRRGAAMRLANFPCERGYPGLEEAADARAAHTLVLEAGRWSSKNVKRLAPLLAALPADEKAPATRAFQRFTDRPWMPRALHQKRRDAALCARLDRGEPLGPGEVLQAQEILVDRRCGKAAHDLAARGLIAHIARDLDAPGAPWLAWWLVEVGRAVEVAQCLRIAATDNSALLPAVYALYDHPDAFARDVAVLALGRMAWEGATPLLAQRADHPDPAIRIAVAHALGAVDRGRPVHGSPEALDTLRWLQEDREPEVQLAAHTALLQRAWAQAH